MKLLYLDLSMGAAGDMLSGALLGLFKEEEQKRIVEKLNAVAPEGVTIELSGATRASIYGNRFHVIINGEEEGEEHQEHHDHENGHDHHEHMHHHTSMAEICAIIDSMDLPDKVLQDAKMVYAKLAQAESVCHHVLVSEVHFHETGMKDAIMDIISTCYLMYLVDADMVIASPVRTGKGTVKCMHGIIPVPAPATEYLLINIPVYAGDIDGEMCTPTGAALISYFVNEFKAMPLMKTERSGYGMGAKDFPQVNAVRAFYGKALDSSGNPSSTDPETVDNCSVSEIDFNVDDMTAEEIAFAMDRLFDAGAAEVFTVPVGMKKCRPGTLITMIVPADKKEAVIRTAFKYTTTIGMREKEVKRYTLSRKLTNVTVDNSTIRIKESTGYGVVRRKAEFDDVAKLAQKTGRTIREIRREAERDE